MVSEELCNEELSHIERCENPEPELVDLANRILQDAPNLDGLSDATYYYENSIILVEISDFCCDHPLMVIGGRIYVYDDGWVQDHLIRALINEFESGTPIIRITFYDL